MSGDPSKNGLVKVGNTSVVRYSNALVRRAIEQITVKSQDVVQRPSTNKRALVIAEKEGIGALLVEIVGAVGIDTTILEPYGLPSSAFSELSAHPYDLIIITTTSLDPQEVLELVTEIRLKYPDIIIEVGYHKEDYGGEHFVIKLYTGLSDNAGGVDGIFPLRWVSIDIPWRLKKLMAIGNSKTTNVQVRVKLNLIETCMESTTRTTTNKSSIIKPTSSRGKKVLIIAEIEGWCSWLCDILESWGFEVTLSEDYQGVSQLLMQKHYDAVILADDTEITEATLPETVISLKADYPQLLVIVMTLSGSPNLRTQHYLMRGGEMPIYWSSYGIYGTLRSVLDRLTPKNGKP